MNLAGGASCCRRRRLLSDSGKRVGDGRGAGEGGFCFATSPGASERGSERAHGGCRRGRPDDAGVGGPAGTRVPPTGSQYVCADPSPLPSPPQASLEGVSAVRPRERPRRCCTVSVPSCSPSASVTHFAQLGTSPARTTPAARPAACHPWGLWRRTHGAGSRAVPSRRAGRGREGAGEKRN